VWQNSNIGAHLPGPMHKSEGLNPCHDSFFRLVQCMVISTGLWPEILCFEGQSLFNSLGFGLKKLFLISLFEFEFRGLSKARGYVFLSGVNPCVIVSGPSFP
jgi:hypothetical protein